MKTEFRIREAHSRFWPQFRVPFMPTWQGYRSCVGATDMNFPTLREAQDYIRAYETKTEIIHVFQLP